MSGITGTGDFYLGSHPHHGSTYATHGIIDEIHLYDHALSESEIRADMLASVQEPSTILLIGSGLVGLIGFRRETQEANPIFIFHRIQRSFGSAFHLPPYFVLGSLKLILWMGSLVSE